MRYFYILFCALLCGITASAQEKISLKDVENYVGKEVTICAQVVDLDSKTDYTYLYLGGHSTDQKLTIVVKRFNGTKPFKLKMPILLGREIACYTGTIIRYEGKPDSNANFRIEEIKKQAERDRPMTIGDMGVYGHWGFTVHTAPVDLQGKLVMMITDQKQISKKRERAKVSFY